MRNRNLPVRPRTALGVLLLACELAALGGCASIGPNPWDRDIMAQKRMQLITHPAVTAADDHIYFSKEGSAGGRTFGGGGCGCN